MNDASYIGILVGSILGIFVFSLLFKKAWGVGGTASSDC